LFAVGVMARHLKAPTENHWEVAIGILDYLKGTLHRGIRLGNLELTSPVVGYSDSDWGGDESDRKSIAGTVMYWGDSIINWKSKKQTMVATSTTGAETHVAQLATYEVMMINSFTMELTRSDVSQVPMVFIDSQPTIDSIRCAKGRNKHYDIQLKFMSECERSKRVVFSKVSTDTNVADAMTKALGARRFQELMEKMVRPIGDFQI
jgi:hypothetical protein